MKPSLNRRQFVRLAAGAGLTGVVAEAFPASLSPAADSEASTGRNKKLQAIPENTWIRLQATMPGERKGGAEVFWAYDAKNKLIVHYGGCSSPYTNEGWVFDLGTEKWTMRWPHDPDAPADRPAGGCSRGLAFDSKRGLVWIYGGASNGGLGKGGRGLYSLDAALNTWTPADGKWVKPGRDMTPPEGNALAYDSVNDLLVSMGHCRSGGADVHVFDLTRRVWRGGAVDPVKNSHGSYPLLTFDPTAGKFLHFGGAGQTWTYDAKADRWTQLKPAIEPPGPRDHCGMAYDARNKVHILCGGRAPREGDFYQDLWVYDMKENTWKEMKPKSPTPRMDTMLFSYDDEHNVCVLADYHPRTPLWVYRYKG